MQTRAELQEASDCCENQDSPRGWGVSGKEEDRDTKSSANGSVLLSSALLGTLPESGQSAVLSTAQMKPAEAADVSGPCAKSTLACPDGSRLPPPRQ